MDDNSNERPGDLTGGLGRNDTAFAAAEARIRTKIATEIAADGSPSTPSPRDLEPGAAPYVATASYRAKRPVLAFAAALVVLVATVGGILMVRSSSKPPTLAAAAAGHPSATGSGPATISSQWIERRDGAVITRNSVLVIDGDVVTETRTAETVVEGVPDGTLAEGRSASVPATSVLSGFSLTEAAGLPTDPDELTAAVTERLGSGRDASSAAAALASIAATGQVPAPVRSAAVAALESISEPPVDGTDPQGRAGALLRGDDWAAIVDRASGLVLAFANEPTVPSPSGSGEAAWWIVWM